MPGFPFFRCRIWGDNRLRVHVLKFRLIIYEDKEILTTHNCFIFSRLEVARKVDSIAPIYSPFYALFYERIYNPFYGPIFGPFLASSFSGLFFCPRNLAKKFFNFWTFSNPKSAVRFRCGF